MAFNEFDEKRKERFLRKFKKEFSYIIENCDVKKNPKKLYEDVYDDWDKFCKEFKDKYILLSDDNTIAVKIKSQLGFYFLMDYLLVENFETGKYQDIKAVNEIYKDKKEILNLLPQNNYKYKYRHINLLSINKLKYVFDLLDIINPSKVNNNWVEIESYQDRPIKIENKDLCFIVAPRFEKY